MKEIENSFYSLIDINEVNMEIEKLLNQKLNSSNKNIVKYLFISSIMLVLLSSYSTQKIQENKKFPKFFTFSLLILVLNVICLHYQSISKLFSIKDKEIITFYTTIYINFLIAISFQFFIELVKYIGFLDILIDFYLELIFRMLIIYFYYDSFKITIITIVLNFLTQLLLVMFLVQHSFTLIYTAFNILYLLVFSYILERFYILELKSEIILKRERQYFFCLVDKTQNGYVYCQDNKVIEANQNFKQILNNLINYETSTMKDFVEYILHNLENVSKRLPKDIYELLTKFNYTASEEKIEKPYEFFHNNSDSDSEEDLDFDHQLTEQVTISKIKSEIKKHNEFAEFFSIGIIKFTNLLIHKDKGVLFYEVMLKVSDKGYEFLFKDYSKNMEVEQTYLEIKNKSLYLAKTAHELKNPLLTITSLLESESKASLSIENLHNYSENEIGTPIMSVYNKTYCQRKNSKFISNLCNYLMFLIEDLNYFSKNILSNNEIKKVPNLEDFTHPFNLIKASDFCLNIFKVRQMKDSLKRNLKISTEYDSNIPRFLYIPETKYKQILINLLSNSYKFTLNGHIKLIVKSINTMNEGKSCNYVRIIVEDTGLGISKNYQDKIFNSFQKIDKHKIYNQYGSGLGLTIVKDLVNSINSKIEFESEENHGSKFWFDIENKEKVDENETVLEFGKIVINKFQSDKTFKTQKIENNMFIYSESLKNLILYPRNSDISKEEGISLNREISDAQDSRMFEHNMNNLLNNIDSSKNENDSVLGSFISPKIKIVKSKFSRQSLPKIGVDKSEDNFKIRILVCDDDDTLRKSIRRQCEKIAAKEDMMLELMEATNGIECLYEIYKAIIKGKPFTGLLIDENMPFMRGSLCLQNIRTLIQERQITSIKVCLVSSYDDENVFPFQKANGPDLLLKKPPSLQDLHIFINMIQNNK